MKTMFPVERTFFSYFSKPFQGEKNVFEGWGRGEGGDLSQKILFAPPSKIPAYGPPTLFNPHKLWEGKKTRERTH